jgi:hypothetical protein
MSAKNQPASRLEWWGHLVQIIQGAATAIALALGAWWFIEQRQTYPHAQLSQSVNVVRVAKGLIAVEVQVQFQNTGKLLIHLTHATVKLQNVAAEPYSYADLAVKNGADYWKANRPMPTPDPRQFNQAELRWPVLKQFDDKIDHVIEPGETDVLVFTFLIPCRSDPNDPSSEMHVLRIASDIHKPAKGQTTDFAWKTRAFADVTNACTDGGEIK